MAKQIKKEEVYESDLLIPLIKQGEELKKVLDANSKALNEFAKAQAKIAKSADTSSAKGIKDLESATKRLTKAQQEKLKIDKQKEQLEARLNAANSDRIQKNEELKVQLSEQNKINKQLAREKLKLVGAYEKESKKLNELRKRYKDLAVAERENTKEGRALLAQITQLDSKLKRVDSSVGQFQRNVGNYGKAFDGLGKTWKNLIGIARNFGLALGGIAIARDAFNVVVDFDQAVANLKAISGASTEELKRLTDQAKQLGATTSFTASEVAGLQTELAKLGFKTDEIEAATESTLLFAKATGASLSDAAALSGSALRAFNLDASEAARVNSVLGVATTKTALDFEKLNSGLSTVAPVANAFGFSIEETTALLGQLSNAGFDASSSATATRNILLNLADANGDLAKALGRPITSVEELAPALSKLRDELGEKGLAKSLELTDARSVAAFQTFLQGADDLQPLVESLTDVEDELTAIAETQDNTLQGALARLRSAWEGYILGVDGSTGASEKLKDIIDFLAKNLDTILDLVIKLGRVFLTFKTALFLTNNVIIPINKGIKQMGEGFSNSATGLKKVTTAFKSFQDALKANLIGLFSIAIVELTRFIMNLETQLETTANNVVKAANFIKDAQKAQQEEDKIFLDKRNKSLNENIKNLEKRARIEIANDPTKRAEIELKLKQQINDEYNKEFVELNKLKQLQIRRIKNNQEEVNQSNERLRLLDERNKKLLIENSRSVKANINNSEISKNKSEIERIEQKISDLQRKGIQFEQIKKDLSGQIKEILSGQEDVSIEITEEKSKQLKLDKASVKERITDFNYEKELLKIQIEREKNDLKKVDLQKKLNYLLVDEQLQKLLLEKRSEESKKQIMEIIELQKKLNDERADEEKKKLREEIINKLREEGDELKVLADQYENFKFEFLGLDSDKNIELLDREIKKADEKLLTEQDLFKLNELVREKTSEQIAQSERQRKASIAAAEVEYQLALRNLDLEIQKLEIKKASGDATIGELKILEKLYEQRLQLEENYVAQKAIIDKRAQNEQETFQNESNERILENQKKLKEKQLEQYQQLADAISGLFDTITEIISKQLDKQIQMQEKYIQASQSRQDFLKQQAAEGNQLAKDSLAAEEAAQAKAEAKKAQAERRKRQLESASIILENIGNLVGQGKSIGEATSVSIASFQAVQALLQNLPAFYDGTEDTGKVGKPLDKNGGRLAVLHDNERVITADQNRLIGGMSNWELAELAQRYNNGVLTPQIQASSVVNAYSKEAVERLDNIEKAIKNKPVTNIEMGRIMAGFMEIYETTQKGSKTNKITHRFRR